MKEREFTEKKFEKITAGYPGSLEERMQILPDLSEIEEEETVVVEKEEIPSIFITENERLVDELPYGELNEEDLDNVMGGRLR